MYQQELEDFLMAVAAGKVRRDLFIFPSRMQRNLFRLDLMDAANVIGLNPLARTGDNTIVFNGHLGAAVARVAHPFLDREMQALEFHRIHGLEHVEGFEEGEAIRANLEMRVLRP